MRILTAPLLIVLLSSDPAAARPPALRAGAAAVDVSPTKFPVLVNGGFLQAEADGVRDPLFARALVLDDGTTRLALVVVDSCMMPRELLDRAKQLANEAVGIPADRILISATHTHTAPAAMGALGCSADSTYVESLPGQIALAIALAAGRLEPARVGHAAVDDLDHTHCRRWIRRPDRMVTDPFGQVSARANMHPGHLSPDVVGPAGPVDPELSVLSVQSADGRPIAVLANYSMHYFGAEAVSADYFGRFSATFAGLVGGGPDLVAMMSQGTSGDQHWMDYGAARPEITMESYADQVARVAETAYRSIAYRSDASLAMAESTLALGRRVPDEDRLEWARPIVAAMGDRPPRDLPEVYAREALFLHDEPERELKLQAVRIGDLAIAAIPNEVYALSGLKIKARSPLEATFVIELANGSEGYIPPREQHALGGYTTWPARTAALEVGAEKKIVDAAVYLLGVVAGAEPRRPVEPSCPAASRILAGGPVAFWRLDEMEGYRAVDLGSRRLYGTYEGGFALYLDGPPLAGDGEINHCVHLAGGSFTTPVIELGDRFTVGLWFWNGLPVDARPVTGDLVALDGVGLRVSLAGTDGPAGRLVLHASGTTSTGTTQLSMKTWHHLALVVDGERVALHLDGVAEPEVVATRTSPKTATAEEIGIGGGPDPSATWEGKLDEITLFDRALAPDEIRSHAQAGP